MEQSNLLFYWPVHRFTLSRIGNWGKVEAVQEEIAKCLSQRRTKLQVIETNAARHEHNDRVSFMKIRMTPSRILGLCGLLMIILQGVQLYDAVRAGQSAGLHVWILLIIGIVMAVGGWRRVGN